MLRPLTLICLICMTLPATAEDWAQFRGPTRDGRSSEQGLLARWPADGPRLLWKAPGLGQGYSSASIAGGRIYVTGKLEQTGYLFCLDRNPKKEWVCLEVATGKQMYHAKGIGKGSVITAGGLLYCYGENGKVALVRATPAGYRQLSSFSVPFGSRQHWAHPSLSDGRLYIRHGDVLMCYDIRRRGRIEFYE